MRGVDLAQLKALQQQYAGKVVQYDMQKTFSPRFIAGGDVGFEAQGTVARAAMVIMTWPELELVEYLSPLLIFRVISHLESALP